MKYFKYILIGIFLPLLLIFLASKTEINYTIKGKLIFMPAEEFVLTRQSDGLLMYTHKDNVNSVVKSFGTTAFERGDVVDFKLAHKLEERLFIQKGDTIGAIKSNVEEQKLANLKAELAVLHAELEFFTTGQKAEDVKKAKDEWDLAVQVLEIQKKITERGRVLIKEKNISEQEFEILENTLKVKEIAVTIAQSNYLSISTGDKPEQKELTGAKINSIMTQMKQVQLRMNQFTYISPLSGMVQITRDLSNSMSGLSMIAVESGNAEVLVSIVDTTRWIGIIPVPVQEIKYIKLNQLVSFEKKTGKVIDIENRIKLSGSKQVVYVTTEWAFDRNILNGSLEDVEIQTDHISGLEFLSRVFNNSRN